MTGTGAVGEKVKEENWAQAGESNREMQTIIQGMAP